MSVTNYMVCHNHKLYCWIGQGCTIYGYRYVDDFLFDHMGCHLEYCDEHALYANKDSLAWEGYKEADSSGREFKCGCKRQQKLEENGDV